MGALIWHDWARFVSITASTYTVWAGFWGIIYRKFFWDFLHGILRDPGGTQPANSDKVFVQMIVIAPILQILAIIVGTMMLTLELPLPFLKGSSIHRSWVVRIVILLVQALLTALFYQGTNAAIYSLIAAFGYIQAQIRGEEMTSAKENRGRDGEA